MFNESTREKQGNDSNPLKIPFIFVKRAINNTFLTLAFTKKKAEKGLKDPCIKLSTKENKRFHVFLLSTNLPRSTAQQNSAPPSRQNTKLLTKPTRFLTGEGLSLLCSGLNLPFFSLQQALWNTQHQTNRWDTDGGEETTGAEHKRSKKQRRSKKIKANTEM